MYEVAFASKVSRCPENVQPGQEMSRRANANQPGVIVKNHLEQAQAYLRIDEFKIVASDRDLSAAKAHALVSIAESLAVIADRMS